MRYVNNSVRNGNGDVDRINGMSSKSKRKLKGKNDVAEPKSSWRCFLQEQCARLRQALWRKETAVIGIILGLSAFFRFYNFFDLGLTHFDEGIYTKQAAIFVIQPEMFYSSCVVKASYSPPLFPLLCGLCFKIFGIKDYIAILPSIIIGSFSCLVVYWLGRRMDCELTGFWAAIFLAINEFHIVFSRLALTDVTFTFFFMLTVLVGVIAWQENRWWLYSLTGLTAGLAMNTKYNGFLPLVLVTGYYMYRFSLDYFFSPVLRKQKSEEWFSSLKRRIVPLAIGMVCAVGIFVLVYLHWYISVDKSMGYDKLMEHHRGYGYPLREAWRKFTSHPTEILTYFLLWSALPLYLAPLGVLLSLWRWRKEFVLLYAWLIFCCFGIFLYLRYTRLALPLLPAQTYRARR